MHAAGCPGRCFDRPSPYRLQRIKLSILSCAWDQVRRGSTAIAGTDCVGAVAPLQYNGTSLCNCLHAHTVRHAGLDTGCKQAFLQCCFSRTDQFMKPGASFVCQQAVCACWVTCCAAAGGNRQLLIEPAQQHQAISAGCKTIMLLVGTMNRVLTWRAGASSAGLLTSVPCCWKLLQ